MAKARRRSSSRSHSTGIPAWFWLLLGLGVGVALAAVFYLQGADRVLLQQVQSPTRDVREVREERVTPIAPLPSAAAERPRFEYQDILPRDRVEAPRPPGASIQVPGGEIRWADPPREAPREAPPVTAALPDAPALAPVPVPAPAERAPATSGILLQTGSFQRREQAEQRRAELILLGLPTQTRTVNINGRDWHRVFVGPFGSDEDARRAEARLRAQNIEALRVSQP